MPRIATNRVRSVHNLDVFGQAIKGPLRSPLANSRFSCDFASGAPLGAEDRDSRSIHNHGRPSEALALGSGVS